MGSFKNSLRALSEFVNRESLGSNVLGIIVFGSFARGEMRGGSDLDILLLKDGGAYVRRVKRADGLSLEVYEAPMEIFTLPFQGGVGRLPFDMFRLQVLRSGKVVYDPWGILSRLKAEAFLLRVPYSYVREALDRACLKMHRVELSLKDGHLGLAESEFLGASIDVARALLLNADVPEINTPRLLLPRLRFRNPEFYRLLSELHGLNGLGRSDVEYSLAKLLGLLRSFPSNLSAFSNLSGFSGLIEKAWVEALNAWDCLESGDYDSAMLQIRLSKSFLTHPLLRGLLKPEMDSGIFGAGLKSGSINEYLMLLKRIAKNEVLMGETR